jgi:hypothetical protein
MTFFSFRRVQVRPPFQCARPSSTFYYIYTISNGKCVE